MWSAMQNLEQRINVAWFKKTGKSNGYQEWLKVRKAMSQEKTGHHFGVTGRTSNQWEKEYRKIMEVSDVQA